ncbi:hypothetical protein GECvBMG_gp253c [Salmonella phage GEC_vB_MG]|nr:hypothetical protein GECvBMG_gp253c [Salmonella phage GEC_vB_MG]
MVSRGSDAAIAKHFRCVWKFNVNGADWRQGQTCLPDLLRGGAEAEKWLILNVLFNVWFRSTV